MPHRQFHTSNKRVAVAVIFLGSRCNMNCTFCITSNGVDSIPFEQAIALLHDLKARGVRSIVLGGGEPFIWPHDIIELTAKAKDLGFTVQVGTNGIALPDGYEHISSIDRYVLPLDGADPETHDGLREYKTSHHALILDRLYTLKKAHKPVTLSTIFTRKNIDGILELAHFLADFTIDRNIIHAWHLYKFIPVGREGAQHADELAVSREEYLSICNKILAMGFDFRIYKRADMYHSRTVEFYWWQDDAIHVGADVWGDQTWERCPSGDVLG